MTAMRTLFPVRHAYSTAFSTLASLPNISSICAFSTISGGDKAMMSPVTRISRPS
jgi:hypothetical protein